MADLQCLIPDKQEFVANEEQLPIPLEGGATWKQWRGDDDARNTCSRRNLG